MKLKVSQMIFLGNIIIISFFVIVSVILFITLNKLENNSIWVNHTNNVMQKGAELISLMVDKETGMRGYLATGNNDYLYPYYDGKKKFPKLITELMNTVSDNPAQVELLKKINELSKVWDLNAASKYISIRNEIKRYDEYNIMILERFNNKLGKNKMDHIRKSINKIPNINLQNELIVNLINMETGLRGFIVTGDENFLEPYNIGLKGIYKTLKRSNYNITNELVNDWVNNYAKPQINDKFKSLEFKNREDLYNLLLKNEGKTYMDKIRENVGAFIEREKVLLTVRNKSAQKSNILAKIFILIGTILTLILGIVTTYILSKKITSQVGGEPHEIADVVKKIAEGNLNIEFDGRESQGIFHSMKFMSNKLQSIISETKSRTETLSNVGLSLSSNAEETSASLTQVSSSVYSLSDNFKNLLNNVEEVTAAVTEITGNIDSLNNSIEQQNRQVEESSSSIEEMVGSIVSVTDNMNKVYLATGELQDASKTGQINMYKSNEQIKDVAEESTKLMQTNQLISNIASKTNLLAMNAAIEAAHAGDAGKGFAVVADEIRKLAESTTQQSHGVSESLKHINALISVIVESSEESVNSFNKIYNMVKTVNDRTEEVQLAMNEQKAGSEQILESLNSMSKISESVKCGANEIKNGSNIVLNEIIELKETINESHLQIKEIATSTKEIDQAVVNVRNISLTNKEMVTRIEEDFSYFKLESVNRTV